MRLYTNREDFYNDLCEVIRLFTPAAAVETARASGSAAAARIAIT